MGCIFSKEEAEHYGFQGTLLAPLRMSFAEKSPTSTIVVIKLLSGKELPASTGLGSQLNNLCNPFVEVKMYPEDPVFGAQSQRSSNKSSTNDPEWAYNEKFTFKLSEGLQNSTAKFVFLVQHLPPLKAPVPICDAVMLVKGLDKSTRDRKITLKCVLPGTGERQGSLTVEVTVMDPSEAVRTQEHAIYEFQRWNAVGGWGGKDNFIHGDPGRWGSLDGKHFGLEIDDIVPPIPPGWQVKRGWYTGRTSKDPDGWEYSNSFTSTYWAAESQKIYLVRRRVWSRVIIRAAR